jgi:RIO-like serine/threonine protein kinase
MGTMPLRSIPVKRAEQRWAAAYLDDEVPDLLAGQTLQHTGLNPLNVLTDTGTAWIIDWPGPPAVPRSSTPPAACCA